MNRLFLSALLVLASVTVSAAEPAASTDPRAAIAAKFPDLRIEDVRPSKIKGIYEIRIGADSAYVSADGKYVITGDMYEIDTRINVTEQARAAERRAVLAKLDERDMIVFAPAGAAKHTITVFTDVDCGYCRKLHGVPARRSGYAGLAQNGSGMVLAGPQDGDHEGQARRERHGAELQDAGRETVRIGRAARGARHASHLHHGRRLHRRLSTAR
jgi:hypothetical protein